MADRLSVVRRCSEGLSILVVDNDDKSRIYLSSMLDQFAYNVTCTELATSAISMVEEQKERFKLVIANVNMPDMDSLQFLHLLLDQGIPVILVSKKRSANDAKRAIAEGASFYLSEPIFPVDLKYIWQHAYRNKASSLAQRELSENQKKAVTNNEENVPQGALGTKKMDSIVMIERKMTENTNNIIPIPKENGTRNKRQNEDGEGQKGKEKRAKTTDEQVNNNNNSKKSRVVWTPQLHLKFTAAISELGDKKARPKPILEIMDVPNLTARQVASHLQKYRCQVQRIYENGITSFPPVSRKSPNIYGRTKPTCKNGTSTGNLIEKIKAFSSKSTPAYKSSSQVSAIPSWKNQEVDCIALIKSLDDGNKKVEVSSPSNGQDQEEKITIEASGREDLYDDEDCFNEWLNDILNMDATEMPNLDNILKSDPFEDMADVLKEDKLIEEPNPSDFDSYLEWITQTLLGDD